MNHYGYSLDPEKMAKKRARSEALLMARLEKDEKDHAALYYMTQLKIGEKNYRAAKEYGERFFHCVPIGPGDFQFYGVMYFYMAWTELHLNDGSRAYAWANKGLEFYPDDIDLNYIMGRIGYLSDRKDLLEKHGRRYLELLPVVRSRGNGDTADKFENVLELDKWFNRTVYSADEAAENDIKKFLEAIC
jgi:hypothetical protein